MHSIRVWAVFVLTISFLGTPAGAQSDREACAKYGEALFNDHSAEIVNKISSVCGRLAEAGDSEAQYYYASSFMFPVDGGPPDSENTEKWMLVSAENGYGRAQFYMASIYKYGTTKKVEKAVEWFKSATESGVAPAPLELGNMYRDGIGVEANGEQAIFWYEYAVEKFGLRNARLALIEMYSEGLSGIEKDPEKVEFWRENERLSKCPNKALRESLGKSTACQSEKEFRE